MDISGLHASRIIEGIVIRQPESDGVGNWVGAPGACYDRSTGTFYLSYRVRRPRGVHPDRGAEVHIAGSSDGIHFEDIWMTTKEAFKTPSMERSALARGPDGRWRCFVSFVDPADNRWCVSVMAAEHVSKLSPERAVSVFRARELGLEGVKDPWVLKVKGKYYMFLSVAVPTSETHVDSHATADIYNTGQCRSQTGLAVSEDLEHWQWQGVVLATEERGWDRYCRRITSVATLEGRYLAFYDGIAGHQDNYEEKAGLAESRDLRTWQIVTASGPLFDDLPGTGSFRYVDVVTVGETAYLYYELTQGNGAHDLRVLRCGIQDLRCLLPGHGSD